MTNELSVEEAVELLKEKRMEINYQVNGTTRFSKALDMAIKALEQTRWIPFSERLPEESGAYLVWMIWGDEEPTYSIINFDADYNEFGEWMEQYDNNTLGVPNMVFRTYIDVFAWMPLPSSYQGE